MDTHLLTAAQAAAHVNRARQALSAGAAHIRPCTIRQWASRGHLAPTGLAEDGRTRLYALGDIARAERATRSAALRMVGIPESDTAPSPA